MPWSLTLSQTIYSCSSHQNCSSWGGAHASPKHLKSIQNITKTQTHGWVNSIEWILWNLEPWEQKLLFLFRHKVRDALAVMFLPQVSNIEPLEMPKMHPMQSAEGVDTQWLNDRKEAKFQFFLFSCVMMEHRSIQDTCFLYRHVIFHWTIVWGGRVIWYAYIVAKW